MKHFSAKIKNYRHSLLFLVKNLEWNDLKSEEYKKFLEVVVSIATRNPEMFLNDHFYLLLKEASKNKVPIDSLTDRILNYIKFRIDRDQGTSKYLSSIIDYCFTYSQLKTLEYFQNTRNSENMNVLFNNL